MPRYEYRCPKCGKEMSVRRPFSEFEEPTWCLDCGTQVERQFSTTSNLHIPMHMQAKHGAGLSWSDFHDVSEKELAKDDRLEPYNRLKSQAGKR